MGAGGSGRVGTVRDWMTRDPVAVTPDLPVAHVVRLMRARGIRHVLVLDGERLAGLVSTRDVPRLVNGEGHSDVPIGRVMTEGLVTVSPETPLTVAARALLDGKIGALPVIEDDRLIGILTKSDALEALLACAEGWQ